MITQLTARWEVLGTYQLSPTCGEGQGKGESGVEMKDGRKILTNTEEEERLQKARGNQRTILHNRKDQRPHILRGIKSGQWGGDLMRWKKRQGRLWTLSTYR